LASYVNNRIITSSEEIAFYQVQPSYCSIETVNPFHFSCRDRSASTRSPPHPLPRTLIVTLSQVVNTSFGRLAGQLRVSMQFRLLLGIVDNVVAK
jgi:hypothetical protein